MIAYKVLQDLVSPYRGFRFEIGKKYTCDDFDNDLDNSCSRGFYATKTIEGCLYANLSDGKSVYACEVGGNHALIDRFKQRWEWIRVLREMPEPLVRANARIEGMYRGYNIEESLFPINPLAIGRDYLTIDSISLVKKWDSVWDSVWSSVGASVWSSVRSSVWSSVGNSVGDSVRSSVWSSVGNSVGDSVRSSVWSSVGASVWSSVGAYISSLFPNIQKWDYIDHESGVNPFQPGIDLWKAGLVPSFDGELWRLHGGKDANVLWEGKI